MKLRRIHRQSQELKDLRAQAGAQTDLGLRRGLEDQATALQKQMAADNDVPMVEVQRLSENWNVSPRIMERGRSEGWMVAGKDSLTITTTSGPMTFNINELIHNDKGVLTMYKCALREAA